MDKPKYYRIEATIKAQVAEDTDALSNYVQARLEAVLTEVIGSVEVYEVNSP
ncbi:hypothetical protein FGG36_gp41 [Mycobacterium phage Jeffabunny]|uniref:Uncharacterized protein n=9 Tax=Caudoviricetes TaxID=2731619 RepID=V5R4M8_9CAUD|nr:hypothetical protein X828_gp051 [Mycobacterium phage Artemis2UCLA]YP_008859170.1 hypothetical protein X821_gp050 [Mycobacterium phage Zaka]YP_009224184.1 hypothetical protein AXJ19_gp050 [Mycobacterium phage VohminGhazi]YP_009635554.1 hypothetical protein FGG54_gp48 [Mycobacterium phage Gladiator]YP_009637865.1 hypothetical protein FGG32_gp048 [Mycobacterium phage EricB]YP_009638234.1 hypothetical protein FGG36_gp41 [Mycobacterium phage Jeffabunny]AEK08503.1 hypothetical protein PBI_DAVINC